MKFKQYVFFLLFLTPFWCGDGFAALRCSQSRAGHYCLTTLESEYTCPKGCFCMGSEFSLGQCSDGTITSSDVEKWCSNGIQCACHSEGQCGSSEGARLFKCPNPYVNSEIGAESAADCYLTIRGAYVAQAKASPVVCPAGSACLEHKVFYGSTTNTEKYVISCNTGLYSDTGPSECSNCPTPEDGFSYATGYNNAGITACKEEGTRSNCHGGVSKNATSSGTWPSVATSTLSAYAGYKISGYACEECGNGSYSSDYNSNKSCTACPTPSYKAGWNGPNTTSTTATSWSQCYAYKIPDGCYEGTVIIRADSASSYSSTVELLDASKPVKANRGYYAESQTSCKKCPNPPVEGTVVDTGGADSTSVTDCYIITRPEYCRDGELHINAAADGTYTGKTEAFDLQAAKGAYLDGLSCTQCPDAPDSSWSESTTQGYGATSVTSCYTTKTPDGCKSGQVKKYATSTTSWGSASVVTELVAKPGYVALSGSIECKKCPNPVDTWTAVIPEGFGDEGGTSWGYCMAEKEVENCNGKLKWLVNNGFWNESMISDGDVKAPAGRYRTGSGKDVKCELCPKGTVISTSGAFSVSSCTPCATGQATNPEHTECKKCDGINEYINDNGECATCPGFTPEKEGLYVRIANQDKNNKSISGCAIQLNTNIDSEAANKSNCAPQSKVIYTYNSSVKAYVRKDNYYVVAANNNYVIPEKDSNFPKGTELKDYCGQCGRDQYGVDGKCITCNNGYCIDNGMCVQCPAGYACPETKDNSHLICANVKENHKCSVDTYAEAGSKSCTICGIGYSTEKTDGNGLCIEKNDAGAPIACTSPNACVQIPNMLCHGDCSCKGTKPDNVGRVTRNRACKASFSLDDEDGVGVKIIKTYMDVVKIIEKNP